MYVVATSEMSNGRESLSLQCFFVLMYDIEKYEAPKFHPHFIQRPKLSKNMIFDAVSDIYCIWP